MPNRIKELATSLEAIIDQYYGPRDKRVIDDLPALDHEALDETNLDSNDEYVQIEVRESSTEDHIQIAALKKTKDVDRAPLMNYLAHWVNQLNKLHENPKPLQKDAAIQLKQEVVKLLANLQALLLTLNTDQIKVTYEGTDVMLYGCYKCKSGAIIQETLFSKIKQSGKGNEDYITELFNAHQSPLLAQENDRLNQELLLRDESMLRLQAELELTKEQLVQMEDKFGETETQFVANEQLLARENSCLNKELSRRKYNEGFVLQLMDEMETIRDDNTIKKLQLIDVQSKLLETETQLEDSEKTRYYLQEKLSVLSRKSSSQSAHVNQSIFKVIEDRIDAFVDYLSAPIFSGTDSGDDNSNPSTVTENRNELSTVNATDFNPHLF